MHGDLIVIQKPVDKRYDDVLKLEQARAQGRRGEGEEDYRGE